MIAKLTDNQRAAFMALAQGRGRFPAWCLGTSTSDPLTLAIISALLRALSQSSAGA